jgi:hypothetical protein
MMLFNSFSAEQPDALADTTRRLCGSDKVLASEGSKGLLQ